MFQLGKPVVGDITTTFNGKKLRDAYPKLPLIVAETAPVGREVLPKPLLPPISQGNDILAQNPAESSIKLPEIPVNRDIAVAAPEIDNPPPALKTASPLERAEMNITALQNERATDNDRSFKKKLGAFLRESLIGAGQAVANNPNAGLGAILGGALGGAAGYGFNPEIDEQRNLDRRRAEALQNYQIQAKLADDVQGRSYKTAQVANIYADNERQQQQAQELAQYRKDSITERQATRESQAKNTKMRTVAQMLNALPSFDPNDGKFADIKKALGDVGLPVYPKDAKKQIKLIQDAETGAWTTVLTDPSTKQQEVRPVLSPDGKQLVTTSTTKVAAEAAGARQESQQTFTAGENEKKRQADAVRQQTAINAQKSLAEFRKAEQDERLAKTFEERKAAQERQRQYREELIRLQKQLEGGIE